MLFDDLPQEKKGPSSSSSTHNQEENLQTLTTASQQQDEAIETESHGIANDNKPEKKTKSLVDAIGNAGTTMAFVPAALRMRKAVVKTSIKPRKFQMKTQHPLDLATATSNGTSDDNESSLIIDDNVSNQDGNSEILDIPEESDIHHTLQQEETYKEPQHLTDLHASIRSADMYHPMMPNDYLAYRQRKENELLQANLEKQAQMTLEMQRKLREQIEEERKKALDSGDVNKIIESRLTNPTGNVVTGGRGRGRGLNNLPAWLVKKQQEEQNSSTKTL